MTPALCRHWLAVGLALPLTPLLRGGPDTQAWLAVEPGEAQRPPAVVRQEAVADRPVSRSAPRVRGWRGR